MSLKELIRANRRKLDQDLGTSPQRRLFSPAYYSQYDVTLPLIRKYAKGKLVDLGCGDMPFRHLIADCVSVYDSLDLFPRQQVTYVGNIQDMNMIASESYDTAICLEVLEHVPDPFQAVREIGRILKPDGVLILSVPHLSRLHDEPYDFYRYTHYGIRRLLEQGELRVLSMVKRGGVFSFIGHQMATLLLGLVWHIPVIRNVSWFVNSWVFTRACYSLDQLLDAGGTMAMGYSAVAIKKGSIGSNHQMNNSPSEKKVE